MKRRRRALVGLAAAAVCVHAHGQRFDYVEPGNPACQASPAATAASAVTVERGTRVSGSISVSCGFEKGSYTVTLTSTDASAVFAPRSFLVNFGRVAGDGLFTVTFETIGVHTVSAAIGSNMGSPAVAGYFASRTSEFIVVQR